MPGKTIKISRKKIRTLKKLKKKRLLKLQHNNNMSQKRNNEQFIEILRQLEELMYLKGNVFKARAYSRAQQAIILYQNDINEPDEIKHVKNIGDAVIKKLKMFLKDGKLDILEKYKNSPLYTFKEIYGVGPKKAKELVEKHKITTIKELREKQNEVLNDVQKKGLKYYEDILKRIPRKEIDNYKKTFQKIFNELNDDTSSFEIVGSYRRGAKNSGDIDIIVSNTKNNKDIFSKFIELLIEKKVIVETLSHGSVKCLAVGKLRGKPFRRVDFMYSPPKEYPFAILYFTGSKNFNTFMRQRALNIGFTMNEHSFHHMENGKKGKKLNKTFTEEKDIFDFLSMEYKKPEDRIDGRSVVLFTKKTPKAKSIKVKVKKNKTLKNIGKLEVKKKVKQFLENGITYLDELTELELSSIIRVLNAEYYNKKPLVTDEQYDIIKEYIEEKYPDNMAIQEVGAPIQKNKITLPYIMPSQNKKKTKKDVDNWIKKYKGKKVVSIKLDGISGLYSTENNTKLLVTRGNGKEGQDISHFVGHIELPNIPNIVIRGEFIIEEEKFKELFSSDFANSRNFVSGVINSKKKELKKWNQIDFVVYEVIKPELKPSDQFAWLKKHNIKHVEHEIVKSINMNYLSKKLVHWRTNSKYLNDGIVISNDKTYDRTDKNPKHAFAFKMVLNEQEAEVKVVDVTWQISQHGYLKPKVQFEAVNIGGANLSFATGHNASFIVKNKINIGSIIKVIRSGDVIPKITKVIKPSSEPKLPPHWIKYKWNETNVDFELINKEDNSKVKFKNILYFFKTIGVDGLAEGNLKKIMKAGYKTVKEILEIKVEDLEEIDGFQKKMALKIYNSIQVKITSIELVDLMTATNLFGRGMGKSRMKLILDMYSDILQSKDTKKKKIKKIMEMDGFAEKTATLFVENIEKFMDFIKENQLEYKLVIKKKKMDTNHPLYDKKIVITGFRDKNFEKQLIDIGAKMGSSVSSKTFLVIVDDKDEDTAKAEKGRELNKLITLDEFKKKYLNVV